MIRILITGSRYYEDFDAVYREMSGYPRQAFILGDCPTGADSYAREYCEDNDIEHVVYVADWKKHGKQAGPLRNREMVAAGPDHFIAFWDGQSTGTLDCIRRCLANGIRGIVIP